MHDDCANALPPQQHTFASFLSRDTTYDLIGNIWRLVHPVVPTSAALPDHHDESDDGEPDDDAISDAGIASGVDQGVAEGSRVRRRLRGFRRPRGGTGESTGGSAAKRVAENEAGENGAKGGRGGGSGMASARPGSPRGAGGKTVEKVHPPTVDTCPTLKNLKEVCMDTVFPSAPEKIYNLMFTSGFMKDFWTENQKLMGACPRRLSAPVNNVLIECSGGSRADLQIGDWAPQTSGSNLLARSFSYIKPLNGSIGPKQTKCLITDESAHVDFDDFVCVITTTRTPDVPSGSAFAVKTRTSMTWSKGNSCRVVVTTGVEWSKSSFIKGIIEKSCIDGQKTYHADLEKAMRAYIATHRNEFVEKGQDVDSTSLDPSRAGAEDGGAGGGSPVDGGAVATSTTSAGAGASIAADVAQNWATPLLEALEPVADLVAQQSLKTLALGVVVAVLVISNLWTLSSRPAKGASLHPAERGRYRQGAAGEASAGSRGGREGANDDPRSPNEVASAVRDVLQDYFAQAGRAAAVGVHESEGDQGAPAAPVGTKAWRVEVDEIEASLDRLEERITGLRASLRDVSVSSTAPAVEVD
ncbi:SPOSA6832_03630 [Sporobolomyces salmonicolor]|uniref:SPOSA6832_03630-mRNA-1:cds n=1 Tax=Sporidiobolus salmonicolor TaxID=5005 RepID=A0A0D6EPK9_SPOSA|nr:SPOSA6832_03630 [Sporobolomyces salmonicolor]